MLWDIDKIRAVLEGFRTLPPKKWTQVNGRIYTHTMGNRYTEECGACVGAWCAVFLDVERRVSHDHHNPHCTYSFWYYTDGQQALAKLLHFRPDILGEKLRQYGASEDPFGGKPWDRNPYDVLVDVVRDRTGYDHREYLRNLPVPLKEMIDHEVLVGMP